MWGIIAIVGILVMVIVAVNVACHYETDTYEEEA